MPHPPCTIATVGNFDGVHAGHLALIRAARRLVSDGQAQRVLALVFDPHPAALLAPDRQPQRLSTFAQRAQWLQDAGVEEVVRLDVTGPDAHVLSLTPDDFVTHLRSAHHVVGFVEGADFRFGKGRAGGIDDLLRLTGLAHALPDVSITLTSGEVLPARSGTIRQLLSAGRVADAAHLLTRPFTLTGTVVSGDRRGRTIGYPTANIQPHQMLPADGVYAGLATLPDGRAAPAAVSIGTKPTMPPASPRTLEAHLLDIGGPGQTIAASEYGWPITLQLIEHLRPQRKFDGLPGLTAAIAADCDRVRTITNRHTSGAAHP